VTQIAVKLPADVLARIDRLVEGGEYANRSQVVRHALESLLARAERRRVDDAFATGFARVPEGDAEMRDAMRLGVEAIHDEPWERWW
jgi:Arc/MetJ-type ribon-helix-helix transcriptional regulator